MQEENIPHHSLFTADAIIFESKLEINNFLYFILQAAKKQCHCAW